MTECKEIIQSNNFPEGYETVEALYERLGYLLPEYKKEYKLYNGITVYNRKQVIKSINKCDKVIAFDTETYEGTCKLLACSNGKHILNPTFIQCLKFLFYKANMSNVFRFFFNIDFDFTSIIKLWNSNNMFHRLRLIWLKNGIAVKYKKYLIKWIKGRLLSIKHITRKRTVVFTDIFNFFYVGLNKASLEYLSDVKIDKIDGNLLNTSLEYWDNNLKDIITYCIKDSILTMKLGYLLIKGVQECKIPLPKYLVSSASLSKQYFRSKCTITRLGHIPEKIINIAFKTYFGGRFEVFKKGFFKELYLYDINSQYPTIMKELPDLARGVWEKVLKIPKRMCMGYFLVKVDIPKHCLIPTIPIHHNGINKFPVGKIKKWMTWFDIDLIKEYVVKVYDGYVFRLAGNIFNKKHRPFWKEIDHLYAEKTKYKNKNDMKYKLNKLTLNAFYGCFIERQEYFDLEMNKYIRGGILFNSVYASQITAFGRWSVIKDIPKDKYEHIIAIHTDSIISDIPLDKYLNIGNKLGQWSRENSHYDKNNFNKSSKGIILNTGMYQIGKIVKTRGIPLKYIKNWIRFCMKYRIYKKKEFFINHMRKISEGLIRDKSLINVNTMMDDKRSVNPNSDTKRDWIDYFASFREVLNKKIVSYPFNCRYDFKNLGLNPICEAYRYEKMTT